MTHEEFGKVIPGKTIINVHTKDEGDKKMLVKFFKCYTGENYDGYWMCCTENLSNPCPHEQVDDDWDVYANNADIISF